MVGLKLSRIPDRTPVKLVINLPPDLHQALNDYSRVYAEIYGRDEPVSELLPAMLASFLEADREFQRRRVILSRDRDGAGR